MKFRNMTAAVALLATAFSTVSAQTSAPASTTTKSTTKKSSTNRRKSAAKPSAVQQQLQRLQEMLNEQKASIDALRQQVNDRDQKIQGLEQRVQTLQSDVTSTKSTAESASATASTQQEKVQTLTQSVDDLKSLNTESMTALQDTQRKINAAEKPAALHYKGITITPGGFIAAEQLWRNRTEQNDVISSFNGVPLNGSTASHMSEYRFSARQSRLSLLAEGKLANAKVTGYYEMDFLGAAPTANENQSNSFNIRQRQLFGQAAFDNGWSFTAGQTWSLITTNKKGIEARGEWVPATIEAQYVVGYNYARLATARVAKTFADKKVTWALSAENPAYLTAGIPSTVVVSAPGTGSLGNGANYSINVAPDFITKFAFDPKWGHYEIKGVGRVFRDRLVGVDNNNKLAGGVGFGMILPVVAKKLDFALSGLYGKGVARYTDSSNVDFTVRPDGTIVPVTSVSVMGGLEAHPTSKLDWYVYGGEEYLGRKFGTQLYNGNNVAYGFGNPTTDYSGCTKAEASFSCSPTGFNRLWEGTTGFWYRFYKGEMGTVQFGMQAEYVHKDAWSGQIGTGTGKPSYTPKGNDAIVMTSFRYYIP